MTKKGHKEISDLKRFLSKVSQSNNCWEWQGYIKEDGYGQIWISGRLEYTHRYSYEIFKELIPKGLQVDHLCRNRKCVNPDHLEVVTQKENILRGKSPYAIRARQTHCYKGHQFNEKNTFIRKNGTRGCRKCRLLYMREWRDINNQKKS